MTDLSPNDLSHLSDEEFNSLAPQGYHATGPAEPLSPAALAVLDAYRSTHLSINNLAAALRAVVKNCSGVDYEGGKRIGTVLCADILNIADQLEAQ
jgi:hypothetical protein